MKPSGKNKHNGRPAHADEQPVGPGHVGNGVVGVGALGVLARHPGKVHVHGVFGQHGDKSHNSHGYSLRNVHLGDFARPGEQKGCAQNGHAREQGHQKRRNVRVQKTQPNAWQGHTHGNDVGAQCANGHAVLLKNKKDLGDVTPRSH